MRISQLIVTFDDVMSVAKEILTKHDVDLDDLKRQIRLGYKVEMEHTYDSLISLKIALDHLLEIPDYYDRLIELEKDAGIIESSGRVVKGVNTTADVGVDEIKTQAAKLGNLVDRDGRPAYNMKDSIKMAGKVKWPKGSKQQR